MFISGIFNNDPNITIKENKDEVGRITILNHYHYLDQPYRGIYIGRGSPYGNPFPITSSNSREEVINKYKEYFHNRIKTDPHFKRVIDNLNIYREQGNNIEFRCFCSPNKGTDPNDDEHNLYCHGQVIRDYLLKTSK